MPQKNWPTQAITRIASAQFWFISAEVKTAITLPKPSLTASTLVAANRNASSRNHPITAEDATDCQMPFAAACSAPTVSSATCAEASYPVSVYIVSRKPIGRTRNQYVKPPVAPSAKPELLICSVKTKSAL